MNETIRVIVTELEYRKAPETFDNAAAQGIICIPAPGDETALVEAVRTHDARHVILGVDRYSGPLYDALPHGGVLSRYGVGFDGIDMRQAIDHGLFCTNTPGVLEESVAEFTITLILAASRKIPEITGCARNGDWCQIRGGELRGKRLAVIGCGQIGCNVARIASAGFGMDVIGCDVKYLKTDLLMREFGFSTIVKSFAEAVENAQYVSLHIPSTPATRHFINRRRLELIPRDAHLINTARGAVVDESALYDAVSGGAVAGAALDVFEHEPYEPADSSRDLRTLGQVIMTPHLASSTVEACIRVADRALRNIQLAENGEYENMDLLNPEVLLNE